MGAVSCQLSALSYQLSVLTFFSVLSIHPQFVILSEAGSFAFANELAQSKDLCTLQFLHGHVEAFSRVAVDSQEISVRTP
jgi:hypothetical protein